MFSAKKLNSNPDYSRPDYDKILSEIKSPAILQKERLFVCMLNLMILVDEFFIFLNLPKNTENKVILTRICSWWLFFLVFFNWQEKKKICTENITFVWQNIFQIILCSFVIQWLLMEERISTLYLCLVWVITWIFYIMGKKINLFHVSPECDKSLCLLFSPVNYINCGVENNLILCFEKYKNNLFLQ